MQPALRRKLKFPAANADFFFFGTICISMYIVYVIWLYQATAMFLLVKTLRDEPTTLHSVILFDNFTTSSQKKNKNKGYYLVLYEPNIMREV